MSIILEISQLSEVYETYFPKIYNYIFYRILHKQITEDLTSRVFLKAAEKIHLYNPEKGAISTWLFAIAENEINDYFRSSKIVMIPFDSLSDSSVLSIDFEEQSELIKTEDRQELYMALSELDDRTRDIISQNYFMDKSLRQIAIEKNMNEHTVSTVHKRGIKTLRKVMQSRR